MKIDVIDNYYQSINNESEVEKIKFINEYQRLLTQADNFWKTIPPRSRMEQEKSFVTALLENELYHFQNFDPSLL